MILKQNHRAITHHHADYWLFVCARIILSGIEVMPMIHKGQVNDDGNNRLSPTSSTPAT
jgi:hypothetical protein